MPQIAAAWDVSKGTVYRAQRRYAAGFRRRGAGSGPGQSVRKVDDRAEAHLIALECSDAPKGHHHWTLRLLAGRMVELSLMKGLSYETVASNSKNVPKPWRKQQWRIPKVEGEFVAATGGCAESVRRTKLHRLYPCNF